MKVKVLEEKLRGADPETGQRYNLERDDVITVPDEVGERWVTNGWAEDVAGKVKTGERREVKGQTINPKSIKFATKSTTKKGGK